jgi:hypothetical protein
MKTSAHKATTFSGCAGDQSEAKQTEIAQTAVVCDHDKAKGK